MTQKGTPFFFDSNFFDPEDPRYTQIDKKKPKLEYTQEHLKQAKEAAFEAGKIAGFKESQASLMQEIQKIVQKIDRDTSTLFAAEDARNTQFEAEAVHLTLKIFESIFKAYTEKVGTSELESIIAQSLLDHKETNLIAIEVHPNIQSGLQEFVNALPSETHSRLMVKSNSNLNKIECKILWANGGITYDLHKIKDRIYKTLTESLAVYGINVQNDDGDNNSSGSEGQ